MMTIATTANGKMLTLFCCVTINTVGNLKRIARLLRMLHMAIKAGQLRRMRTARSLKPGNILFVTAAAVSLNQAGHITCGSVAGYPAEH